jgi:hypothetical protein
MCAKEREKAEYSVPDREAGFGVNQIAGSNATYKSLFQIKCGKTGQP